MNPLMGKMGGSPQQFNQFAQMMNMIQGGANPQNVINLLAQNNPQMAQAIQMLQGKSPQQMEQIMRTMCANKGINFDAAFAQFKQMLGQK